ncbi:MAG: thioesterase [Micrococcales bacterium 73-13]|nr:MAG: thioesterase [Micrococcales bacterium 73-13]
MVKFPDDIHPALLERLATAEGGPLVARMGIELLEVSAARSLARMPVEGNTQTVGILHGGAHLVLGETLGSLSSAVHGGPTKVPVGIEIGASHSRSVDAGWVTATCIAISLGRTLCTHEIAIDDEQGRRLSTVRMTNYLKDLRP